MANTKNLGGTLNGFNTSQSSNNSSTFSFGNQQNTNKPAFSNTSTSFTGGFNTNQNQNKNWGGFNLASNNNTGFATNANTNTSFPTN